MNENRINGVNIDQLIGTINAVKEKPELAKFIFHAKNKWISGGNSVTTIQNFYGVGQEISREKQFEINGDEPPVLLGENLAPNAVEAVLHALASCLAVGIVYNASAKNIKINKLEFDLDGDIDLQGFLGLSDKVHSGYQNIRVNCRIDEDAPREELEKLCQYVQKTSPVLDIIRNPINVSIN